MDRQRANVGKVGVARYLTAPPANASQEHQEQQRQRIQERERSASVVVDVSSAHGKELRHLARDPEARKAKLDAERAERDRIDSEREAARVQRAKDALARRTPIPNPTAQGMARLRARCRRQGVSRDSDRHRLIGFGWRGPCVVSAVRGRERDDELRLRPRRG